MFGCLNHMPTLREIREKRSSSFQRKRKKKSKSREDLRKEFRLYLSNKSSKENPSKKVLKKTYNLDLWLRRACSKSRRDVYFYSVHYSAERNLLMATDGYRLHWIKSDFDYGEDTAIDSEKHEKCLERNISPVLVDLIDKVGNGFYFYFHDLEDNFVGNLAVMSHKKFFVNRKFLIEALNGDFECALWFDEERRFVVGKNFIIGGEDRRVM